MAEPGPTPGAAELCADQVRRWEAGERLTVEDYLALHSGLAADADGVLDLIYNEVLLREASGQRPTCEEYIVRFPGMASALRAQFEIHRAIQGTEPSTLPAEARPSLPESHTRAPESHSIQGYDILGELGRGAMGVVLKGYHKRLRRPAAIKMLLGGRYAGPATRARFRIEAEAVAQLQHPHIVSVYHFGEHDGLPFLE